MPRELPAKSPVTIQQIDRDTWVIRRIVDKTDVVFIAVPLIKELPSDPAWEKTEAAFARHAFKHLPPFEE